MNTAGLKLDHHSRTSQSTAIRFMKSSWEHNARATFLAHARCIPPSKLRFLQYVTPKTREWWAERREHGTVPLGKAVGQPIL